MTATGVCKSFNGMKGWGFIEYNGQDIFVHIKDCNGGQPKNGDNLTFDLEESKNKPGQYQAKNVNGGTAPREDQTGGMGGGMGGGGGGKGAPVRGTGSHTGTCKSFNPSKGFGFVSVDGLPEGSMDGFTHLKECIGSCPAAGDKLQFDMEESRSKPGQYVLKNVTGGSAPLPDQGGMGGGMGKGGSWGPMMGGMGMGMGGMGGLKGGMMMGGMGGGMGGGPYGKGGNDWGGGMGGKGWGGDSSWGGGKGCGGFGGGNDWGGSWGKGGGW